jgi:beta-N-acetylhexosaminidase
MPTGHRRPALAVLTLVLGMAGLLPTSCGGAIGGQVADRSQARVTASPAVTTVPLGRLIGQRLLVAMQGTSPDPGLLYRIRFGRVGGVILFGSNIADATQVKRLTATLQAAAKAGGQPPLLIATDQEGGLVRRLPWAPPVLSAEQLGTESADQIHVVGARTGAALRAVGINLDLAPVADIPRTATNFIAAQHRAFSTNRYVVARDVTAFSTGLEASGVLPTLKHFPGLGRAGARSTDDAVVRILASQAAIDWDLFPYRIAISRSVRPVIMLSTAIYPAYSTSAAAWSTAIGQTLLRTDLGFGGVTITDSLNAAASVRGVSPTATALRAALAGADLLLLTGSEQSSGQTYLALLQAAQTGDIPLSSLQTSYQRIVALKRRI